MTGAGTLAAPWLAVLAAALTAGVCAALGVYVVLRRMAFIGDALAHTVLPGMALALLLGWSVSVGALSAALLAALGIGWLSRGGMVREDTAIGVLFTAMFAAGVLLTRQEDPERLLALLLGRLEATGPSEIVLLGLIAVVVGVCLRLFHKEMELVSFDPTYAESIGLRPDRLRYLLLVLLALTIVAGIQAVGVLLTTALLVTPAAAASLLTNRLPRMMALAVAMAVVAGVGGLLAARALAVAAGPAIVLACTATFGAAWLVRTVRGAGRAALVAALFVSTVQGAWAQPPSAHALVGARVVVAPGEVLDTATIVLRDGLIAAVGPDVEVPPDARIWDLAGRSVYPGLIDPYVVRRWPEGAVSSEAHPLIHPEREIVRLAFDPDLARRLRAAGVTTALTAPGGGILRGWSAVTNLGDGPAGENLLTERFAQHASLDAVLEDAYPASRMGAIALFRQTMADARWYRQARAAHRRNPAQRRPPVSPALEALSDVSQSAAPIVFETTDAQDVLRAAQIGYEQYLDPRLVAAGDEYKWVEEIQALELPLIVPLAFPPRPEVAEDDELTVQLRELRHWEHAPDNPLRLVEAGVRIAFTTHGLPDPRLIHGRLAQAVERGLAPEEALRALTTTPAAFLDLSRRAGTITPGKMANLVVVAGELFVENPPIEAVWIDGRHHPVDEVETAASDPSGGWQLTLTSPGREIGLDLQLVLAEDALRGTVTSGESTVKLDFAAVSGARLELAFAATVLGAEGQVTLEMDIEGGVLHGSGRLETTELVATGSRTRAPKRRSR